MSNVSEKEIEKARREYEEAWDYYRKLAAECVSVFGPGVSTFALKVKTTQTLKELNEAYDKVSEALKKWHNLVLLYSGLSNTKSQSP